MTQLKLSFDQSELQLAPIFINEDYTIESTEHISDTPVTLLGIVNLLGTAKKAVLDLDYQTFYANPALATNRYIILVNQSQEWLSINSKITKVEIIQ